MEQKKQIINIVNFIRGYNSEWQPFGETYLTVKNQIKLIDKYNFKATFLIQYDALTFSWYQKLMPSLDKDRYEIGVWFEVHKSLCEACGIKWRGRRNWDGHVHCGFSMGYTNEEKMLLLDKLFEQFKSVMGYYPRVLGSWFFDTFTARYVSEKYGIDAFCNCKEQYGTDGYTLWGGYYGQAYYPSKKNMFIPAQNEDMQIPVPLFKMLGSDQVYQFDFSMADDYSPAKSQSVITLEPVYHDYGGGLPKWVDWYLEENFNGECLSFGYAQAGQENSFGWQKMKDGLFYQFDLFDKMQKEGKIVIEQLGESGRWFKENYKITPASTITAHSAYDDPNKDTVWFCNKNYRINLYGEDDTIRIRDLHIFDEDIEDPFEHEVCKENYAVYDTLPVVDGYLYSGNGVRSGVYFYDKATDNELTYDKMTFEDKGNDECRVCFDNVVFDLSDRVVIISAPKDFVIKNRIGATNEFSPSVVSVCDDELVLIYKGNKYALKLQSGKFVDSNTIESMDSKIIVELLLVK